MRQRGRDARRGDQAFSVQSAVHIISRCNQPAPHNGVWTPFKGTTEQPNFSYLHEREHKRDCAWRAQRKAHASRNRSMRIWNGTWCSLFARLSWGRCKPNSCWIWRELTLSITTRSSTSAAPASRRRSGASRPRSHRAAASAIRVGDRNRDCQPAHCQNSALADAE